MCVVFADFHKYLANPTFAEPSSRLIPWIHHMFLHHTEYNEAEFRKIQHTESPSFHSYSRRQRFIILNSTEETEKIHSVKNNFLFRLESLIINTRHTSTTEFP
jgi:hypothetical protein